MGKIRYGVIGAGFFGEKHIEVLSTLPNVDVAYKQSGKNRICSEYTRSKF